MAIFPRIELPGSQRIPYEHSSLLGQSRVNLDNILAYIYGGLTSKDMSLQFLPALTGGLSTMVQTGIAAKLRQLGLTGGQTATEGAGIADLSGLKGLSLMGGQQGLADMLSSSLPPTTP
jgi:hypothetical protein